MKALLLAVVTAAVVSVAQGQGYFQFDNLNATGTITIATGGVGEGNGGDYPGSTYTAALYYSLTPISGPVFPSSLTLLGGSQTAFFGTTGSANQGHSPAGDGAGLFDGGAQTIPGSTPDGTIIYVEAVVYWSAAGSFPAALAAGDNTGYSSAVAIRLASGIDNYVADLSAMTSFEIGLIIPEPATLTLGALGGAALLLFRKRK